MDVTTCVKCGVYTPFNKKIKEDLCPDCKIEMKENGIDYIFDCEDCDTGEDTWNWDENLL